MEEGQGQYRKRTGMRVTTGMVGNLQCRQKMVGSLPRGIESPGLVLVINDIKLLMPCV